MSCLNLPDECTGWVAGVAVGMAGVASGVASAGTTVASGRDAGSAAAAAAWVPEIPAAAILSAISDLGGDVAAMSSQSSAYYHGNSFNSCN